MDILGSERTWNYGYSETVNGQENPEGLLTSVESPESVNDKVVATKYIYYTDTARENLLKKVIDPNEGETTYEYYANRRGFQVIDTEGQAESLSYDLYRNQTSYTNANGDTTHYTYDSEGRVVQELFSNRTTIDTVWENGLQTEITDQFGQKDYYVYDSDGNLTGYVNREGFASTYSYTSFGNIAEVTNKGIIAIEDLPNLNGLPGTLITGYTYYSNGALRTVTQYLETDETYVTNYACYSSGLPSSVISPLGNSTNTSGVLQPYEVTYQYNNAGQVVIKTSWVSATEAVVEGFIYDDFGRLEKTITGLTLNDVVSSSVPDPSDFDADDLWDAHEGDPEFGNVTIYSYDNLNRKTSETLPYLDEDGESLQLETTYIYDAIGNLKSVTAPGVLTTEYKYDKLGRLIKTIHPDDTFTTYSYDSMGNLIAQADELGHVTQMEYDSMGRLVATIAPDGSITRTTYDGAGRVATQVDARANADDYEEITVAADALVGHWEMDQPYEWQDQSTVYLTNTTLLDSTENSNGTFYFPAGYDYETDPSPRVASRDGFALDLEESYATIQNIPFDLAADATNTISFWMKPDTLTGIPITSFDQSNGSAYSLLFSTTDSVTYYFGFTSGEQQLLGVDASDWAGKWVHITAVFKNGDVSTDSFELYVNGQLQELVDYGTSSINNSGTKMMSPSLQLSGNTLNDSYRFDGIIDDLQAYNRKLTVDEIELIASPAGQGVTHYEYDVMGRVAAQRQSPVQDENGSWSIPTTQYDYDDFGNLEWVTDPQGNQTHYEYDNLNRQTIVTDVYGNTTETHYDGAGNVSWVQDKLDNITNYTYDGLGRLIKEELPDPGDSSGRPTTTYTYDSASNLQTVTDARANASNMSVAAEDLVAHWSMDGKNNISSNPLTQEDLSGNNANLLLFPCDAVPGIWGEAYDLNNNEFGFADNLSIGLESTTLSLWLKWHGPNFEYTGSKIFTWHTTEYGLSNYGIKVEESTSGETKIGFDFGSYYYCGTVAEDIENSWVHLTAVFSNEFSFDGTETLPCKLYVNGNLLDLSFDDENIPTLLHTGLRNGIGVSLGGELNDYLNGAIDDVRIYDRELSTLEIEQLSTISEDGMTYYEYDSLNRIIAEYQSPVSYKSRLIDRPKTTYTYNDVGQLESVTDPEGNETHYRYDTRGRLTHVLDALCTDSSTSNLTPDHTVVTTYDAVGNVVAVTDQLGNTTNYVYDERGRLLEEILPDPIAGDGDFERSTTSYSYDENGNLTSFVDAENNETQYEYDSHNRQTAVIDAYSNSSTTAYDIMGNVASITDKLDNTTNYKYDALGRLIEELLPAPREGKVRPKTTYTYDAMGNLLSVTDANSNAGEYDDASVANDHLVLHWNMNESGADSTVLNSAGPGNTGSLKNADGTDWTGAGSSSGWVEDENRHALFCGGDAYVVSYLESLDTNPGGNNTVSFWMNWDGTEGWNTPFSWSGTGLSLKIRKDTNGNAYFGFSTEVGDCLGVDATGWENRWIHVTAVFKNSDGVISQDTCTLYINGEEQDLAPMVDGISAVNKNVSQYITFSAWEARHPFHGMLDELRIYNCELTASEAAALGSAGTTRYDYDALGRVIAEHQSPVVAENGDWVIPTTTYTYDAVGNTTSIKDPRENITNYEYDALGRKIVEYQPPVGDENSPTLREPTTYITYDLVGNVVSVTDPRGNTTDYGYDALGRLVKEQLPDPDPTDADPTRPTTTYTYDAVGNLLSVTDANANAGEYDDTIVANDNLASYWKLDEKSGATATSETEYTEDATLYNFDTSSCWVSYEGGDALAFSADDHTYVSATVSEVNTDPEGFNTVSFWMKWNGSGNYQMPFQWAQDFDCYDLIFKSGRFGFNTGQDEVYGVVSASLINQWVHVTAVFKNYGNSGTIDNIDDCKLYINGELCCLSDSRSGTLVYNAKSATNNPLLGGTATGYSFGGLLDDVRIYNHELTADEIEILAGQAPMGTTRYEYDALGQVVAEHQAPVVDETGKWTIPTTTYTYDAMGRTISTTDALGNVTDYTYDALGRLTQEQLPDPDPTDGESNRLVTTYTYDAAGNLLTTENVVAEDKLVTHLTMDRVESNIIHDSSSSDVFATISAVSVVEAGVRGHVLDFEGNRDYLTIEDPDISIGEGESNTVSFWMKWNGSFEGTMGLAIWEEAGYSLVLYAPNSSTVFFGFNTANYDCLGVDASGWGNRWIHVSAVFYNGKPQNSKLYINGELQTLQQKRAASTPETAKVLTAGTDLNIGGAVIDGIDYAFAGQIDDVRVHNKELTVEEVRVIASQGAIQYQYDALGRVTTEYQPLQFDENGNCIELSTTYTYDVMGHLTSTTDAEENTTYYRYDALGRQTHVIDALCSDSELTDPDHTIKTTYDEMGNVVAVTDQSEHTTNYEYDALGRLKREILPAPTEGEDRPETNYIYDFTGNLCSVIDSLNNTTDYKYDTLGRLIEAQLPDPDPNDSDTTRPTTTYTYDMMGNVLTVTDANANANTYADVVVDAGALVGHWKMDQLSGATIPDSSCKGNNGTWDGSSDPSWESGKSGNSLDLDGDCVSIDNVPVNIDAGTSNTISFWMKPENTSSPSRVISCLDESGALVYALTITPTSTSSYLGFDFGEGQKLITIASSWSDKWTHVTAVFENGDITRDSLKLYVNGELRNLSYLFASPYTGDFDADVGNLFMSGKMQLSGWSTTDSSYRFDGLLDAVQVYNRELTPDEIKVLANQALQKATRYEYDTHGRVVAEYQSPILDENRDLVTPTTTYTYDAMGRTASMTDALGNTTNYTYDALGRMTEELLPAPSEGKVRPATSYTYDSMGNLVSVTDALGNTTDYTYDALGRVTEEQFPDMDPTDDDLTWPTTTYIYDAMGRVISITDAEDKTTHYRYDALGRQTHVIDALCTDPTADDAVLDHTQRTGYDDVGNIVSTTDECGLTTLYDYDALGRLTLEGQPGYDLTTRVTQYDYDAMGNLLSVTDEENHITRYRYDTLGRQTHVISPLCTNATATDPDYTTVTNYDANGNVISITDAEDNETSYVYNALGQVIGETDATNIEKGYTYNALGLLVKSVDRNGRIVTYAYDDLGRVTEEKWFEEGADIETADPVEHIETKYDTLGRITRITDSKTVNTTATPTTFNTIYEYHYNSNGLVTKTELILPGYTGAITFDYKYDKTGNLTQITDSIGGKTEYDYDALYRLETIQQTGTNIAAKQVGFTYKDDSRLETITRYAGIEEVASTEYTYYTESDMNNYGRLKNIIHRKPSTGQVLWGIDSYSYFLDGTIQGIEYYLTEASLYKDAAFQYSEDNQIENYELYDHDSDEFEANDNYTYDENGNRTGTDYTTTAGNRLTNDGTYAYDYDDEGNLTSRTLLVNDEAIGETTRFVWDHRNRLVRATKHDTSTADADWAADYIYDAFDQCIAKLVDGSDENGVDGVYDEYIYHLYQGDELYAQLVDGDGAADNETLELQRRYLYGSAVDQVLAVDDVTDASYEVLWGLADHEGSIRQIVNNDGDILESREYDAFGEMTVTGTADLAETFPQSYTGRPWDEDIQLYQNRARWYDPVMGRFISTDPSGFSGGDANLYRYCNNSAVNYNDPSGLCYTGAFNTALLGLGPVGNLLSTTANVVSSVASSVISSAVSSIYTTNTGYSANTTMNYSGPTALTESGGKVDWDSGYQGPQTIKYLNEYQSYPTQTYNSNTVTTPGSPEHLQLLRNYMSLGDPGLAVSASQMYESFTDPNGIAEAERLWTSIGNTMASQSQATFGQQFSYAWSNIPAFRALQNIQDGMLDTIGTSREEITNAFGLMADVGARQDPFMYELTRGYGAMDKPYDPATDPNRWAWSILTDTITDPTLYVTIAGAGAVKLSSKAFGGVNYIDDVVRGVSRFDDVAQGASHFSDAWYLDNLASQSYDTFSSSGARVVSQFDTITTQAPRSNLGRVVGQADAINPGSLADDLAGTFSGGRYTEVILDADTMLYRTGTANRPLGQFFDTTIPEGILQSRIDKAILPKWPGGGTSPIDSVIGVQVPKGTRVFVGEVSTQGGIYVGGTQQIVVPKPWTIDGVQVKSVSPLQ